jgi:hypothetical protein
VIAGSAPQCETNWVDSKRVVGGAVVIIAHTRASPHEGDGATGGHGANRASHNRVRGTNDDARHYADDVHDESAREDVLHLSGS